MKTNIICSSLLLILMPLAGCGSVKKRHDHPTQLITEYFTHGNPERLLAGTKADTKTFLKLDNVEKFQGFHLAGGSHFTERSVKYNPKDWNEVEKANATTDSEADIQKAFAFNTWSFTKITDTRYELKEDHPQAKEGVNPMALGFEVLGDALWLADVSGVKVKIKHYSLAADEKAFSFLFTYDDTNRGQSLLSLTFAASNEPAPLPPAKSDYSYLYGSMPLGWRGPISLDVCGKLSDLEQLTISSSISAWFADPAVAPATESVPVTLTFKTEYPPFSDLNAHCLTLVENFKMENSERFHIAGVTLPRINSATKAFIDGDIFIFMDHVRGHYLGSPESTTIHEVGHFWGLGHEFAEDARGVALYESVMGYEHGTPGVTARDFEAVRGIYGKPLARKVP